VSGRERSAVAKIIKIALSRVPAEVRVPYAAESVQVLRICDGSGEGRRGAEARRRLGGAERGGDGETGGVLQGAAGSWQWVELLSY
jgi:hypothetical protein